MQGLPDSACSGPAQASGFNGGDGTATNPWLICTYTQLGNIRNSLNSHYKLGQNIDASASWSAGSEKEPGADADSNCTPFDGSNENIGDVCTGHAPIGSADNCDSTDDIADTCFQGQLDGNGFAIRDLHASAGIRQYDGLFGAIGTLADISRLEAENRICRVQARKTIWTESAATVNERDAGRKMEISSTYSFNDRGEDYTINELYWEDSTLHVDFGTNVREEAVSAWTALEVGSVSVIFNDAEMTSYGHRYQWPVANPRWVDGQTVAIKLIKNASPTNLLATATSGTQIDLSWTAAEDDASLSVAGYRIDFYPNGASSWKVLNGHTRMANTTYSHTGLSSGSNNCYRVRSIHPACIAQSVSATACATTPFDYTSNAELTCRDPVQSSGL